MLKADVLKHFNNRVTDVAAKCRCSVAAVSQWGEIVPEVAALKLDKKTKGKLKYDEAYYTKAS